MLAGSPLRTVLNRVGHFRAARPRTVHPIDSFDKTGRLTLESFNSRAVRADCNVWMRYNDRTGSRSFRRTEVARGLRSLVRW